MLFRSLRICPNETLVAQIENTSSELEALKGEFYRNSDMLKGLAPQKMANEVSLGADLSLLILADEVTPSELASQLREMGIEDRIEYIQPDYELQLDSLRLELVDMDDNNDETKENQADQDQTTDTEEQPGDTDIGAGEEDLDPEQNEELVGEEEEELEDEEEEEKIEASPVIVAIIDTGVDRSHPVFENTTWGEVRNFANDSDEIYDPENPYAYAHGTHIAGEIAKLAEKEKAEL